jgi:hypothetical protein
MSRGDGQKETEDQIYMGERQRREREEDKEDRQSGEIEWSDEGREADEERQLEEN